MENLDIIILTSIVSTLFIVFGILMYKEFSNMEKTGYKYDPNAKKYGRDALFEIMARLFEDEAPKEEKAGEASKEEKPAEKSEEEKPNHLREPERVFELNPVWYQNRANTNMPGMRTTFYNKKGGVWMDGAEASLI